MSPICPEICVRLAFRRAMCSGSSGCAGRSGTRSTGSRTADRCRRSSGPRRPSVAGHPPAGSRSVGRRRGSAKALDQAAVHRGGPRAQAVVGARRDRDQTVLNAAFDAVLVDFKAADAGEIDCLVIGVATHAERIEVLGASPPLEDIDPCGVHRIGRDREVQTTRCLAGEAHSTDTCHDMGVSVRWIEDEVTGDDEHPPIVPTSRCR
jgi:hypothetical protein